MNMALKTAINSEQELEIILESEGKEVFRLRGKMYSDREKFVPGSISGVPYITELIEDSLDSDIQKLYKELIRAGETINPKDYILKIEIKPYKR